MSRTVKEKRATEQAAPEGTNSYIMHPRQVATQWVKGQKGNSNLWGMSNKEAAQARINAKSALRIRHMLLDTMESQMATQYQIILDPTATAEEIDAAQKKILGFLSADTNTMLRDAETRGLGAPKVEVKIESSRDVKAMTDEELEGMILEGEFTEIEEE